MLFALSFILLGVIFLLKNLGVITVILVGVWILWKRYEWRKWKERIWRKLE